MKKKCKAFEVDITNYASGGYEYIKDYKSFFDHLRECADCRNKLFQTQETFELLDTSQGPPPEYKAQMEELLALSERELPPEVNIASMKEKALQLIAQRQYEKSIKCFQEIKEYEPENAGVYANIGVAYIGLNKLPDALVTLTKALELDPKRDEVYTNRGSVYLKLNQPNQALTDLNKAIELNPSDSTPYFARGWAYERLGQYEDAITDFTKVLELNPRDIRAYFMRGLTYGKQEQSEKAIADFTQYLAKDPKSVHVYHNRGVTYRVMGEIAKASADFKKAISLNPEFQPSANELKALEKQALWQEFETRINEIEEQKKKTPKDDQAERIKALEDELKILKEQIKSLTEIALQKGPAAYLYPTVPAFMPPPAEEKLSDESVR